MNKRWLVAPVDAGLSASLAGALEMPVPIAQVLINRGFREIESAQRFLHPQLRQLGDPFEFPDMAAAVTRILAAIDRQERIAIYGDYDVDGITSSALLVRVLRTAGATVENFLPLRMEEGYGLSRDGLARCLQQHQPRLLIAVDCGTSSRDEIAFLSQQGVDVIVLDHHEPPAQLPECIALVNPKLVERVSRPLPPVKENGRDARSTTPFASVGVAFKLAHALLKQRRELADRIDLRDQLDLVALGTVADLVPLTGENRTLVKIGLERLAHTKKIGLRALMKVAAVTGPVTSYHIGFRLGPRLNAAGRLADAMAALNLLLTEDSATAVQLASALNNHNLERQQIEERIVQEALTLAATRTADKILVVANAEWHNGVIGIVASRITQQFYRPAVVIGQDGKGSCRSVAGFSIVAALNESASLLIRHGGHEMAAGLTIVPERVPDLLAKLNAYAAQTMKPEILQPLVHIDAVVQLSDLNDALLAGLEKLEPCGQGNPTPVFAATKVSVRGQPRVVGRKHLKFELTDGARSYSAIWWGMADAELPTGALDVAFIPELNEYAGTTSLQLKVRAIRKTSPD